MSHLITGDSTETVQKDKKKKRKVENAPETADASGEQHRPAIRFIADHVCRRGCLLLRQEGEETEARRRGSRRKEREEEAKAGGRVL